jgi:4-aminobutyrate aminotransferase / (S)-3-amino-2-methylpropionate transaminase / 5-aminovalerate transaminase
MNSISLATPVPGPKSLQLTARRHRAVPSAVAQLTPIFVDGASGATITDVDGNVFLDFYGGIGCINAGHAQPPVTEAIRQQAKAFLHTCFMVAPYESYVALAETMNRLTPGSFEKRTFFVNSGAEAVENGIKIARSYTGRPAVICFDDAYHGRTYMAMSVTAKEKPYKYGFGPFSQDIYRVPFANPYRCSNAAEKSLQAIEQTFRDRIAADKVAAILFEPVEGEGGFIVPPVEFVLGLRTICDKYGIVLIVDEVQTGFGRTGRMFACEHFGLLPDIILTAKSIASGLPLAACTGRAEIMNQPGPGALGGTFGGNPVACTAALATINLFADGSLLAQSNNLGRIFVERAKQWQQLFPFIGDIRGLGGMQAIELVLDRNTKQPAPELTKQVTQFSLEHGVLLVTAGTYGNVIRLLVPLIATDAQMHEGLDVLEAAFHAVHCESSCG